MSSTPSLATQILEAKFLKEIKRDHKCSLKRVALRIPKDQLEANLR